MSDIAQKSSMLHGRAHKAPAVQTVAESALCRRISMLVEDPEHLADQSVPRS
jgi:hypothetical protein